MPAQTIALIRFIMLGILSRRLVILVAVVLLAAVLSGSFVGELAIINSRAIVTAFVADFLRYSLAFLLLLLVATSVAEDYEFRQFERLLTMPLARWQYVAAQAVVIAGLCLLLVIPVLLLMAVYSDFPTGLYWALSLWLEMFMLGLLGFLAILSLEKIPQAVFFSVAVYLLAKLSDLIEVVVSESVKLSDGSAASRAIEFIFSALLYLFPGSESFARNDAFFHDLDLIAVLGEQLLSVGIYSVFLIAVCLFDFYRKEFNL